jgi:electron transfer flavoprotein alpha subunit
VFLILLETPHDTESQINQLTSMIKEYRPIMLFLPSALAGRAIAPRLAVRMDAALISDCVDFRLDKNDFTACRNIMNGKAQVKVSCSAASFFIATVCTGIYDILEPVNAEEAEVIQLAPDSSETPKVKFLEYIQGDPVTISIREADAIIAIGRGLGNTENLPLINELAVLLGASIGGTRTAVDFKWLPLDRQIGITGETVSPRLFISCGISGQYPHTVGMDTSDTIIVINKDRDAPMFKLASLGIIGAIEDIIPALSRHIKDALTKKETRPQ